VDVAKAVEANEAEFLLALGKAGGGEERDDEHVQWTIGGSPIGYHNAVVRASVDASHVNEIIVASQALMRTHGVPGSWHVGPSMGPDDLGSRLLARGFEGGLEPGMAAELDAMPSVDMPAGLEIARLRSDGELDEYGSVLAGGFGEGPPEAAWVCEMYRRIGLDDDTWRHFVGRIDGSAVACATTSSRAVSSGCTSCARRRMRVGAGSVRRSAAQRWSMHATTACAWACSARRRWDNACTNGSGSEPCATCMSTSGRPCATIAMHEA
jgi:hypothetical protein